MTDRRLYSRQGAADYLGKSLRAIDYLVAKGELIARKDGRRTVIDVKELDRFADRLPALEPGVSR